MPSFTSREDRSDQAGFIFSSSLPVTSRRLMMRFFPQAIRVKRSLDATIKADGGLLFYELVADVRGRVFTVASAWRDEASFTEWVAGDIHGVAMSKLGPHVSDGTFKSETVTPKQPAK